MEHLDAARASGRRLILFSGHLGNWEILSVAAIRVGLPMTLLYRSPNNPGIEKLLADLRRSIGAEPVPKGRLGAKRVVGALREGRVLGMLVDQKMREGLAVPFFGRPAMTATAAAELALRYRALLIPVRVRRLRGAHFRITVEPPRDAAESGDSGTAVFDLLCWINSRLEAWIRDDPGQWFWLHRRWPDS
jgi:KDO2-lipid IV(A) lauroyltransferase